jgi:hypothetical protein
LALGLSDPDEIADLAMVLQSRNEVPEAIALLERSLQWSPANVDYRLWALGDIHFSHKHYSESLMAVQRMKNAGQASRLAAAASAQLGFDPERYVRAVLAQQPQGGRRAEGAIEHPRDLRGDPGSLHRLQLERVSDVRSALVILRGV